MTEKDPLKNFKLIENKLIYSDEFGKLIGWNQQNNVVVLFSGSKDAIYVEGLDAVTIPKEAIPELIEFLKRAKK